MKINKNNEERGLLLAAGEKYSWNEIEKITADFAKEAEECAEWMKNFVKHVNNLKTKKQD